MRHITACIFVLMTVTPGAAQEVDGEGGLSLMERGAQMLLEGLMREMEPAMDGLQDLAEDFGPALRDFTAQMGPALRGLLEEVDDWSAYHPPEMLDNGDIIIRRKTPDKAQPKADPDAQIDIWRRLRLTVIVASRDAASEFSRASATSPKRGMASGERCSSS